MKPGRMEIPELGAIYETQPNPPEAEYNKNIELSFGVYKEFIHSSQPRINKGDFSSNINYRSRLAEKFVATSKIKADELRASDHYPEFIKKTVCALLGNHVLIKTELLKEQRDAGIISNIQFFEYLKESVHAQQETLRLILQNRNAPMLDSEMKAYWHQLTEATSEMVSDPDAILKRQHGIEHAVTASHILENRGWRVHIPQIKDDVERETDAYATGVTNAGKEIILAVQIKPSYSDKPVAQIDVLHPLPHQTEINEDAWNLVENVKKRRISNPSLPLYPIIMRIPPAELTQHIRNGTGLLASGQATDQLLDIKSKQVLEYTETLADSKLNNKKRRKKVIYVPQAK